MATTEPKIVDRVLIFTAEADGLTIGPMRQRRERKQAAEWIKANPTAAFREVRFDISTANGDVIANAF